MGHGVSGNRGRAHGVPDERDPGRIDIRQLSQVPRRDLEILLQYCGGRVAGRHWIGVGAVPGEVQQYHYVALSRQRVAEGSHQLRRTRVAVSNDHPRATFTCPQPGGVNLVERNPVDDNMSAAQVRGGTGEQPTARPGRDHSDQRDGDRRTQPSDRGPSAEFHTGRYREPSRSRHLGMWCFGRRPCGLNGVEPTSEQHRADDLGDETQGTGQCAHAPPG